MTQGGKRGRAVHIEFGQSYERRSDDGKLIRPDAEMMARAAFRGHRNEWFVPDIDWVKDFPGQVTDGRVGRPAVRFVPLSWAGDARKTEVERLLAAREGYRNATGGET